MNEPDPSLDDGTTHTPETPEENISLDAFAAQASGEPATADPAADVDPNAEPEPSKPQGRHRARSQRARPEDTPRIAELTRRLRVAEAERDTLKGTAAPVVAPAAAKTDDAGNVSVVPPAPPPRAAAPLSPVKAAGDDPEPDSEKYDDLTKWMRDHSRWAAREEIRAANAEQQKLTQAEQGRQEAARLTKQWDEQLAVSRTKYPDFDAIAFAPTQIPQGSLVDAWIREHKTGQTVLYHLQKSPTELHAMLALPLLDQVEALTLLSQRLSGARTAAVGTGAAPASIAQPVSRPPTPVRTGTMRPADDPPDPEASTLSSHQQYYGTPKSRRARS